MHKTFENYSSRDECLKERVKSTWPFRYRAPSTFRTKRFDLQRIQRKSETEEKMETDAHFPHVFLHWDPTSFRENRPIRNFKERTEPDPIWPPNFEHFLSIVRSSSNYLRPIKLIYLFKFLSILKKKVKGFNINKKSRSFPCVECRIVIYIYYN